MAHLIGTSYTGIGSFSLTTIAGEIAPVALPAVGCFAPSKRFDCTATHRIAFVALAPGFSATTFWIGGPTVAQACFNTSNVTIMALTVTAVCAGASMRRASAAWAHSVLMLDRNAIALGDREVACAIGSPRRRTACSS